jgi:hypothetical protein
MTLPFRVRNLLLVLTMYMVAGVSGQTLSPPANDFVFIPADVPARAVQVLVGRGISLPEGETAAWTDGQGNEVTWRKLREHTDARGGRHVFYRQEYVGRGTVAELHGSEIGLHYNKSGKLWMVAGNQFTTATPTNRVAFAGAVAVDRAPERAHAVPNFRAEPPGRMTIAQRVWRNANTQLKLISTGAGTFRYAWFTYANDVHGEEHAVVLDAETAEVLSIGPLHQRSNCNPSSWQTVSAIGQPVRLDLRTAGVQRTLKANVTYNRPSPYTREAFWPAGPLISITQQTETQAFKCDQNTTGPAYTLFPVIIDGTTPTYRDDGEWRGFAAGDVLHNTKLTMEAFALLGRSGWDGNNGDANVVTESTYLNAATDYAYFRMSGSGDPRVPPTPFLGIARTQNFHNPAAALDVVAHEWGHGVIFTGANFPCSTDGSVACQLHEGFADVIGTIVEKMKQPTGTGIEQSSDWTIHEDNGAGGYHRGAVDDGSGHTWTRLDGGTVPFNHFIHRQDITGAENSSDQQQQQHARGTMLHMVLRLLTEGGENPICSREPTYQGCGTTTASVGFTKASQILFDTVSYYAPAGVGWAELATYASAAAFDLYANCDVFPKYSAGAEQFAVKQNFEKIGYPRLTSANTCQ